MYPSFLERPTRAYLPRRMLVNDVGAADETGEQLATWRRLAAGEDLAGAERFLASRDGAILPVAAEGLRAVARELGWRRLHEELGFELWGAPWMARAPHRPVR